MRWSQNKKLVDYEMIASPEIVDANLLHDVVLTFEAKGLRAETKRVTYIVGTDTVLTVFRKVF